jgi:cell fate regulator YaaT (PSP1 superfamily)
MSQVAQEELPNRFVVRCGFTRVLCVMNGKGPFRHGTRVIARTPRGQEVGEVLCVASPYALQFLKDPPRGQIVREVTAQDENELEHLRRRSRDEFSICQRVVEQLQLPMQLVDVEHLFGGERVIVYYLAEDRVDFRQLVKDLGAELQTRIEMRQIGVRDEAKLLADYGDCGKPVCCNTHLSEMPPVSMRMAKMQKATLDPAKISGRCGRLKCCLRYEFDTYEELQRQLPPIGAQVVTKQGRAGVLGHEILAQQLLVEMDDGRRIVIAAADVLSVLRNTRRPPPSPEHARDQSNADEAIGNASPVGGAAPSEHEAESNRVRDDNHGPDSPPINPSDPSE